MRGILFGASLICFAITATAQAQLSNNTAQPGGQAAGASSAGSGANAGGPSGQGGAVMAPGQGRVILLTPDEVGRLLRAQQAEAAGMTGDQVHTTPMESATPRPNPMMMGERESHAMPSGASFRFKRGGAEIDIKCADNEPTTVCVTAAAALIDKVDAMHPSGAPAGGGSH